MTASTFTLRHPPCLIMSMITISSRRHIEVIKQPGISSEFLRCNNLELPVRLGFLYHVAVPFFWGGSYDILEKTNFGRKEPCAHHFFLGGGHHVLVKILCLFSLKLDFISV